MHFIAGFNKLIKSLHPIPGLGALCLLLLLIQACGTTKEVPVTVVEPAPVELSQEIKRIGVISSCSAVSETTALEELEPWISHTDTKWSKEAKKAALQGLFQQLSKDTKFDTILLLDDVPSDYIALGENTEDIDWDQLNSICVENNVDALFALASFQTDTEVSIKKTRIEQKNLLREVVKIPGNEITLRTMIENGWRIYDPAERSILDEITINDELTSSAQGEDPYMAFQAIEDRKDSLISKGSKAGHNFGSRLQPYSTVVWRDYYTKGSTNMEKADSLAQSDNWQQAAALWKLDIVHPKEKIRARAQYNLAVANELHGDLDSAVDWATKSYDTYASKSTELYLDQLQTRILNTNRIEEEYIGR